MNFKKISTGMLLCILPIIIIALVVLTVISASSSKKIIENQITSQMEASLNAQKHEINNYLETVRATATSISRNVGNSYETTKMDTYISTLSQIVMDNDLVLGSGIWFEPNVYDAKEKFMGPYVVKDGDKVSVTYDYSNAEYDYFNQDYYKIAKESKKAIITDPYYDPTSRTIMASCTMPIFNKSNTFIGCVTVDIKLDSIEEVIKKIKIGKAGKAVLLSSDGTYLGYEDKKKVEDGIKVVDEKNSSLAKAGKTILEKEDGITSYQKESQEYNLYYSTLKENGWKIIISMPVSELNQPVRSLTTKLIVICIVALIVVIICVLLYIRTMATNIQRVQKFATNLSEGDFTVDALEINSKDELGQMGQALNSMYGANKSVIGKISDYSSEMDEASTSLNASAGRLTEDFNRILEYMTKVNEDMMTVSAATEEVNASAEEVNSSIDILAEETQQSKSMSDEIKKRADQIGIDSQNSYDNATRLALTYEERLEKSIENAKVVDNIGALAEVISNIAEQINLLSLNASIEAARAGEQGKGFAVVAAEIGSLATETATAVNEIQSTISDVQSAFNYLTEESKSLLEFIQKTVTPDYNNFIHIAEQYKIDAVSIEGNANNIDDMATTVREIMREVGSAIQSVAESAQNTADHSAKIMDTVNEVSEVVDEVSNRATEEDEIATTLAGVVSQFKL